MAVTTGTTIANIYYAQPILAQIDASFGILAAGVGFLPALSQWGMALGILFLVPLGDMLGSVESQDSCRRPAVIQPCP